MQEAGGQLDDDELIVARHVTSAGRSRAYVGGAQVPASVCAELTAHWSGSTAKQSRSASPRRIVSGSFWIALLVPRHSTPLARYTSFGQRIVRRGRSWPRLRAEAQRRAREIDLLRFGLDEIERIAPALRRGCRAGSRGAASAVRRRSPGFGRVSRPGTRWAR